MLSNKRYALVGIIALIIMSLGTSTIRPMAAHAEALQQAVTPTATVVPPTSTLAPTSVPTQTPIPVVVPTVLPTGDSIPFSSLGQQDYLLYGPFDATSFSFGVPSEWVLQQAAQLQLNLTIFVPGSDIALANQYYAGSLLVKFNNQIVGQVSLSQPGDIVVKLDIPVETLKLAQRDGRHQIALEFDSGLNCISNLQMNLLIRSSSLVIMPHVVGELPTDLNLLPRPIIQRSFMPDTALIVVPDVPSAAELQAAMAISSGLGRMSAGRAVLSLIPVGQLTDELRQSNHIVMVGKPEAILALNSAFTVPTSANVAATPAANADDGIVQMLVSPWNAARAVLLVTGASDTAIIKAGQAVSVGQVRSTDQPNLALVSEIHRDLQPNVITINRTLAELGYPQRVMRDSGSTSASFNFFIPADKAINGDAYFDLWFAHSGQLDFGRSNASVLLNDQPVGGLALSQDTTRLTKLRFGLPRSAMHTGLNEIKVDANLLRTSGCYINDGNGLWMSIMPESTVFVPLGEGNGITQRLYDLSLYPSMFLVEPNLSKLALVVAQQDTVGWQSASQLAFNLGTRSTSSFSDIALAYADAISEELRTTRDLIVVGRPSTLPVIAELNDRLPAPFEQGSDLALERNTRVQYRIMPGASIGYIQLLQSPWNPARGILAVLGSDSTGVMAASNALTIPEQRGRLNGTLAIIDRQQIISASNLVSLQLSSDSAPVAQVQSDANANPGFERPAWLMPTIIGLGIALVALIIGVILMSLRRKQVGIR